MIAHTLRVMPYLPQQRRAVLDLLFYSWRVHAHLDWHELEPWLDLPGNSVYAAWEDDKPVAVIGACDPLEGGSWLRVLGVANGVSVEWTLPPLWEALRSGLLARQVDRLAVMVLDEWLNEALPGLGFHFVEYIVTLGRSGRAVLGNVKLPPEMVIRSVDWDEAEAVCWVDHAAFLADWRMRREEVRQALRIAASTTAVFTLDGRMVGYQLSTVYQQTGHLARLAVDPAYQGQGIGQALVQDLIMRFGRRHIHQLTVNTQESNVRSQRLYQRLGFRHNGYNLPVWGRDL